MLNALGLETIINPIPFVWLTKLVCLCYSAPNVASRGVCKKFFKGASTKERDSAKASGNSISNVRRLV